MTDGCCGALADFEPGCRHHPTAPESPFPQLLVSRAAEGGRRTVGGLRWMEPRGGEREKRAPAPAELGPLLAARSGIELDAAALSRLARAGQGR